MRVRALAMGVGAATLVAAVVLLREQVEPAGSSVAGPETSGPPASTAPATELLPVLRGGQRPRWRTYDVPPDTLVARADPEHVVLARAGARPAAPSNTVINVRSRDGSGREASYGPPTGGWQPADWLMLDGRLFVLEIQPVVDGESFASSRVVQVHLDRGLAEPVAVRSVRQLGPALLAVGDELIVYGPRDERRTELCVVAVRPSTGAERTVVCGPVLPILESADGGVLIKMPDTSPDGCLIRLLLPGRGQFGLPVFVGSCRHRRIIPLGVWQGIQHEGSGPAMPLLASDGNRRLRLGAAKVSAAACHGRLYWVVGGQPDSPYGTEVHRWIPGGDHVDLIYRASGETELGRLSCVGGALSVRVLTAEAAGSQLVALRVLDPP